MCAAEQKSDVLGITREEEEKNMFCVVTSQVKLGCVFDGTTVVPPHIIYTVDELTAICY